MLEVRVWRGPCLFSCCLSSLVTISCIGVLRRILSGEHARELVETDLGQCNSPPTGFGTSILYRATGEIRNWETPPSAVSLLRNSDCILILPSTLISSQQDLLPSYYLFWQFYLLDRADRLVFHQPTTGNIQYKTSFLSHVQFRFLFRIVSSSLPSAFVHDLLVDGIVLRFRLLT
jgi:hypothetical protein